MSNRDAALQRLRELKTRSALTLSSAMILDMLERGVSMPEDFLAWCASEKALVRPRMGERLRKLGHDYEVLMQHYEASRAEVQDLEATIGELVRCVQALVTTEARCVRLEAELSAIRRSRR